MLSVHANPFTFILPYSLIGLGMSGLFAPLTTEAIRRVRPELIGSLTGMLATARQLGSAIGSAVVGGVLATFLASDMRSNATAAANQLPAQARAPFLGSFAHLGQGGLSVGRGQSGGVTVPTTVPAPLRPQVQDLIHSVFTSSYVDAMRLSLVIPVALLLASAITCALLLKRR